MAFPQRRKEHQDIYFLYLVALWDYFIIIVEKEKMFLPQRRKGH